MSIITSLFSLFWYSDAMKTEIEKKEHSSVEIKAVMSSKDLEKYRDEVVDQAVKQVKIDGFREGKVPRDRALKELDPMRILEEMAHRAISAAYVDILEKHKIKAIGQPQIQITKIAEAADLEFSIHTAVLPEVKLPAYKKLAKEENKKESNLELSDADINEALLNLRKMSAQQAMADSVEEGKEPVSWNDLKEEDLPQMDDAWAQGLGNFKDLAELKEKISENLKAEKASQALEKKRMAIIDAILAEAKIDVPEMMLQYELDKMMHELEHNIAMTGVSFDDYLKSIQKTKEDYRSEWKDQAYKRAQTQLMLNHIAAEEKIDPSDEEIEAEVSKIMQQYQGQQGIDENNVRAYVATVLTHQKVFEFLDAQK